MTRFQYSPLPGPGWIRLLLLPPASTPPADSAPAPLSFDLVEHEMNREQCCQTHGSKNPWAAISYTWDGQTPDPPALCNGHDILLTKNSETVLRTIQQCLSGEPYVVWIDQVCIDQDSIADKNLNVANMDHIYEHARLTLIWFGDLDRRVSQELLKIAGPIGTSKIQDEEHLFKSMEAVKLGKEDGSLALPAQSTMDAVAWLNAVFNVIQHPWFKRAWTLQEFVLGHPNRLGILIGPHIVSSWYLSARGGASQRPMDMFGVENVFLHLIRQKGDWRSLANMVQRAMHRDCTNPRDKVFLYGILRRKAFVLKYDAAKIPVPDYGQSVYEVYANWTEWAIGVQGSPVLLYHAVLPKSHHSTTSATEALPSWVPDYARIAKTGRRPMSNRYYHTRGAETSSVSGSNSAFHPMFLPNQQRALRLSGKIFDTVKLLGGEFEGMENGQDGNSEGPRPDIDATARTKEMVMRRMRFFLVLAKFAMQATTTEAESSQLIRTDLPALLRPFYPNGAALEKHYSQPDWVFVEWMIGHYRGQESASLVTPAAPTPDDPQTVPAGVSLTYALEGTKTLAKSTFQPKGRARILCPNVLCKSSLLKTGRGSYGICFGTIEEGDLCAAAAGVNRMLILRPQGEAYRLVGNAYIQGAMDGEIWPADEAELESLDIV